MKKAPTDKWECVGIYPEATGYRKERSNNESNANQISRQERYAKVSFPSFTEDGGVKRERP